jgi:hypothetical protein
MLWIQSRCLPVMNLIVKIETPIVEKQSLFVRSLGTETDVVKKEMFLIQASEEDPMCLRPEGTAGVIRAVVNANISRGKFFYFGPMFRYERPQKGRARQACTVARKFSFGSFTSSGLRTLEATARRVTPSSSPAPTQSFARSESTTKLRLKRSSLPSRESCNSARSATPSPEPRTATIFGSILKHRKRPSVS